MLAPTANICSPSYSAPNISKYPAKCIYPFAIERALWCRSAALLAYWRASTDWPVGKLLRIGELRLDGFHWRLLLLVRHHHAIIPILLLLMIQFLALAGKWIID